MNSAFRREYGLTLMLAGLCLFLGIVILFEWVYKRSDINAIKARLDSPEKTGLELEALSDDDFVLPKIERYAEMVEKPLLVKERRPIKTAEEETIDPDLEVKKTKLNSKLMGVISTPAGIVALILNSKTGRYVRAKQGEEVDNWRVTEVQPDKVILKQGNETEELQLRKPKPKHRPKRLRPKKRSQPKVKKTAKK